MPTYCVYRGHLRALVLGSESSPWEFLVSMRTERFLELGSLILVAFDITITLNKEIRLVWKRPINTLTLVYLANRYFVLIQAVLYVLSGLGNTLSPGVCQRLNVFTNIWSVPLVLTSIQSLVVLRLSALFKAQPTIVITLWSSLLIAFVATLAMAGLLYSSFQVLTPPDAWGGCFLIPSLVMTTTSGFFA
ncbi:hypothetical protein CALCODRAFT_531455 [Calocera cornea HHB12733]|uniref:DUF6533 domain-containing protein n=1 Tax=Calocera cornea HHB12733 TaxID=1353952 RepID=A0A165III2_9BASI|nr:hypothetical protein CALCODRAFT_531455 [Calocera cornea HHB12733]